MEKVQNKDASLLLNKPTIEGYFIFSPKTRPGNFYLRSLPLLMTGLVLGLSWLIGVARGPLYLDIGGEDRQDILYLQTGNKGFFPPEKQPYHVGDTTFRWMGKEATLYLPWPLDAVPLKISLKASAPRPYRLPDQVGTTLAIREDGKSGIELALLNIIGEYTGTEYEIHVPDHPLPDLRPLNLHFEASDTFQPGNGDPRLLALVVFNLKMEPDYSRFGISSWLATLLRPLLLAGLTLAVWWLARLFSLATGWRLTLQAIAGFFLVLSLIGWPLAAEPLFSGWTVLLPAFGTMVWLAGRFVLVAPKLPAPFIYTALFLPLMPLAQWLFSGLDLTNFSPASVAFFLYFAALIFVLIGYFFYRFKFEPIFLGSFLLVSLMLFFYNHWWVFSQNLYKGGDFRNYYLPLINTEQHGTPLYNLAEMTQAPYRAVRMPPSFAILFWPFLKIFGRDVNSALFAWRITNELLLIPTGYLLLRIFGKLLPELKMGWVIIFLTLSFNQFAETVAYGQLNIFILLMLTLMAYFMYCRRDYLSGLALAVPTLVKLLPGLCVIYFLIERRWRGLGSLIACSLFLSILTILAVGWDNVWFYFSKAIGSVNDPELGVANQSWWGFLGRLATNEVAGDFKTPYPHELTLLGYAGTLLGLASTFFVIWRARRRTVLDSQLALEAFILLPLLISPFSWIHYIVQGFGAIVAVFVVLSGKVAKRPLQILLALCFALLAYGGREDFFGGAVVGLARLSSSYRFFATFTLWLLCLWLLWNPQNKEC